MNRRVECRLTLYHGSGGARIDAANDDIGLADIMILREVFRHRLPTQPSKGIQAVNQHDRLI